MCAESRDDELGKEYESLLERENLPMMISIFQQNKKPGKKL